MTAADGRNGAAGAPGGDERGPTDGGDRAAYVRAIFDALAPRYDRANLIISAGLMPLWRRALLRRADPRPGEQALDVGCGTGGLLFPLARALGPGGLAVGVDISPGMLDVARRRLAARQRRASGNRTRGRDARGDAEVRLIRGNATDLPFDDAEFDLTVNAFILRNIAPLDVALGEMARVTRRGGRALCLEVSRPDRPLWRSVFSVYWHRGMPLADRALVPPGARRLRPYAYLARSIAYLPDPAGLMAALSRAGFSDVARVPLLGGAVAIYEGRRP